MADAGQTGQALVPAGARSAGSAMDRAGSLARAMQARFASMPPTRRNWLAASALLVAAVCAGLMWYAARPDWRLLFSGLDSKDVQQVAQELSAGNVSYQVTEDGTGIEVSAEQVDKARMEVASKGMPQSGRMGFELFDKPNWVGSEFDEKVNYRRALEGELEHTIGTLAVVRSARVHVVLAEEPLFGEEPEPAKASVVLQLRRPLLPPDQAEAIRSLVAGAVENLSPENVTLVDADGRLNLAQPTQDAAADDEEHSLEEKLVSMLEPTVGEGNVRATVNIAYDEGTEEKTDEVYDPSLSAPLSTHKTEQTTGVRARPGGIPGTASNTPGASAAGTAQGASPTARNSTTSAPVPPLMQTAQGAGQSSNLPVYPQGAAQGEGNTMTEETNNFAVTRHLLHSEEGPGRIRKVTAAVVVNDRMEMVGAGKQAHNEWKPRSAEEMRQLEQLARAAVGFDASRGDQVAIENISFSSNTPEASPVGMQKVMDEAQSIVNTQPALLKTLSVAGIALLLTMVVLRPVARQMSAALSQTPALALGTGQAEASVGAVAVRSGSRAVGQAPMPSLASLVAARRPTDTQEIYHHISEQIRREPAQSTRLLESWINAPVEEDE